MTEPIRPHPVGGVDYPRTFQELQSWFPDDQACLLYLEQLRPPDLGDRRDDLSPDPHTVVDLVRGDLVPDFAEERHVRAGSAAGARVRVLRDCVGVVTEAPPGHGQA